MQFSGFVWWHYQGFLSDIRKPLLSLRRHYTTFSPGCISQVNRLYLLLCINLHYIQTILSYVTGRHPLLPLHCNHCCRADSDFEVWFVFMCLIIVFIHLSCVCACVCVFCRSSSRSSSYTGSGSSRSRSRSSSFSSYSSHSSQRSSFSGSRSRYSNVCVSVCISIHLAIEFVSMLIVKQSFLYLPSSTMGTVIALNLPFIWNRLVWDRPQHKYILSSYTVCVCLDKVTTVHFYSTNTSSTTVYNTHSLLCYLFW